MWPNKYGHLARPLFGLMQQACSSSLHQWWLTRLVSYNKSYTMSDWALLSFLPIENCKNIGVVGHLTGQSIWLGWVLPSAWLGQKLFRSTLLGVPHSKWEVTKVVPSRGCWTTNYQLPSAQPAYPTISWRTWHWLFLFYRLHAQDLGEELW